MVQRNARIWSGAKTSAALPKVSRAFPWSAGNAGRCEKKKELSLAKRAKDAKVSERTNLPLRG